MSRLLSCALVLVSGAVLAAPKGAPTPPAGDADEVNAIALFSGAREVLPDGTIQSDAARLTDGLAAIDTSWEPRREAKTISAIYRLAEPFDLARADAINSFNEPGYPGISTKRIRLEHGGSPEGPWKLLGEATLKKGSARQAIAIAPASGVRFVRVTLLENFGNEEWWSLAELGVYGRRTKPRAISFTGAWETNYGEMVLKQDGQRITGCYGGDEQGRAGETVEGTLEGSIFFGTWHEAASQGTMAFALTAENELAGVWGNDLAGRDRTGRWDGTPIAKATITCARPEKRIASDLASGRVVLRGILFDTGKDTLRPESTAVLQELAAAMREGDGRYVVEGHTDDRGGAEFNKGLSDRRAATVKGWLVKAGIAADRLEAKGFGASRPALPNDSEAGRAANRRVEVAVAE